jgi:hypothetical protein
MRTLLVAALVAVCMPMPVRAGLYCAEETVAELPSQWRGFLLDQRALRLVAVKPTGTAPAAPMRSRYEAAAEKLANAARERTLTPDDAAELGALYLRLGDAARALEVLRPAQREHPAHFRLAANLGTAWQLNGDLAQAAACLEQAVRLAPGKYQRAEELHLRLVRQRAREPRGAVDLDDLFGIPYVGPSGKYEPGKLADEQRRLLPSDAAASLQLLALWLPADARLLWQVGEMAGAQGDVGTAAAVMDGCVTEFGLRAPVLLEHRRAARAVADALARTIPDKATHRQGHGDAIKARSSRPLVHKSDLPFLPPVDPKGVNALPWSVLNETALDRESRPTFPDYLKELNGKRIELIGFMQPLGQELNCAAFMLVENPIGCWFCEMPAMTGIVIVELEEGKTFRYTRNRLRVTGRLTLNATNPERFLFVVGDGVAAEAE